MADLAGEEYWSRTWSEAPPPPPIDPDDAAITNHPAREWEALFASVLRDALPGAELVEVGCARSVLLPYLARRFGVQAAGIDYSEKGCDQARLLLEREGVEGDVVHADVFSPPPSWVGRFDYAVSMGVVEHFDDTGAAVRAIAELVKPGGTLVTVIPNLRWVNGWIQRRADKAIHDLHVPLGRAQLARGHEEAGLEVLRAGELCVLNLWMLRFRRGRPRWWGTARRWMTSGLNRLAWWSEQRLPAVFRPNPVTSPYVVCVARKPQ